MDDSYYQTIDRYCYTRFMLAGVETVCQMSDKDQRRLGCVARALYRNLGAETSMLLGGGILDTVLVPLGLTVGEFALGSRERRDRTQRRVNDTNASLPSKRARAAMLTTLVEVGESAGASSCV